MAGCRALMVLLFWSAGSVGLMAQLKDSGADKKLMNEWRSDPEVHSRLTELMLLPPEKFFEEINKWPRFQQMNMAEQGRFLTKISEIKERQRAQALAKIKDFGLTLTPPQQEMFIQSYSRRRAEVEQKIWQETLPLRQQLEAQMDAEMKKEFNVAASP